MAPASLSTEIAQPWSVRIAGRRSMAPSIRSSNRVNPCARPFVVGDLTEQGFDFVITAVAAGGADASGGPRPVVSLSLRWLVESKCLGHLDSNQSPQART